MNTSSVLSAGLATALSVAVPCRAAARTSASAPALDEGQQQDVKAIMAEAAAAFEAKQYETALVAFQAAYEIAHDPNFLFNIGRVHEEAGQLALAVEHYERFINEPSVQLDNRKLAFDRVSVLKPIVEQQARDREALARSSGPTGATGGSDVASPTGQGLTIGGAVVTGLGGTLLVTGGVVAGLGRRDARRADAARSAEERNGRVRGALTKATAGDALLISGGVLLAVGIPLLVTGLVRKTRARRGSASGLRVVPTRRGIAMGFRF